MKRTLRPLFASLLIAFATSTTADPVEPVMAQARANKQPLLDTLKSLVEIVAPVYIGTNAATVSSAIVSQITMWS